MAKDIIFDWSEFESFTIELQQAADLINMLACALDSKVESSALCAVENLLNRINQDLAKKQQEARK